MIIDGLIKLFKGKTEKSMQKRAEESRCKEVDDATDEFNETTRNLQNLMREIKGRQNHG